MARLTGIAIILGCWVSFAGTLILSTVAAQSASPALPNRAKLSLSLNENAAPQRADFVGDSACSECHHDINASYERTTHYITSQYPAKNSIAGKFTDGKNVLETADPELYFRMDSKPTGFYETAVFRQPPNEKTRSERIDFVTGSGEKGQTYLYWRGNQLFQLPVSYWTELDTWVNSPGFPDGVADFDRPIVPRCLECHATYFDSSPSAKAGNFYNKTGIVLGISCERCHGPGRKHVEMERLKPSITKDVSLIVNPTRLSRDLEMDVCAQCHGGIGEPIAPAFSYVPGEALENYIKLQRDANTRIDVHGNQVALTQRSRCYQNSQMTCSTCHQVHEPERPAASYSEKCLQCHKATDCGEFAKLGTKISDNCVDCHMPVQQSDLIISNVQGKPIKARMRNHWIKIYPADQIH
jgi:Cytochrome c554 and c-prime